MNLYLIQARRDLPMNDDPWDPWYDKAFGFVVRAESESEARALANQQGGGETYPMVGGAEREDAWLNPDYSTCAALGAEGAAGVIIQDFRAA